MDATETESLLSRLARLESEHARLKAEAAVYRGALVWLMGFHQLAPDDRNPHRAVLEPLGLDLSFQRTRAADPAIDPGLAAERAKKFVTDAEAVFVARQAPKTA